MIKTLFKFFSKLIICCICIATISSTCFAETTAPRANVGDYGDILDSENRENIVNQAEEDVNKFTARATDNLNNYTSNPGTSNFVPIEAKVSLIFMKALSSLDKVLQMSLVKFVIIFLLIMYTLWVAIEGYRLIKSTGDSITTLQDIAKKGIIVSIWVFVLYFEKTSDLFNLIITPIINIGTYFSDLILNTVANIADVHIPDTCAAIRNHIAQEAGDNLLIDQESAANIICLPGRLSTFFAKGILTAFGWIGDGFVNRSFVSICVGIYCVFMFIKCVIKFAFMTLGVVASLFLTLLLLPFTALAEALPQTSEKGYIGQIFNGLLKVFNTKKLSDHIATFINASIYFVSLSIIIAICAIILSGVVNLPNGVSLEVHFTSILLGGTLVLYLASKAEDLAKQIGGSIDNTVGKKLYDDTKTLIKDAKNISQKLAKAWSKEK